MPSDTPKHRFFSADLANLANLTDLAGRQATLLAGEAHHALHVLRLKVGAAVEVFDGAGRLGRGRISATRRDAVTVDLDAVEGPLPPLRPRVHLAFSAPKGKRLDWLLEKAAELGAASLRPIHCERSVVAVELDEATARRWTSVCASAVRQSGQVYLPQILRPVSLTDAVTAPRTGVGILASAASDATRLGDVPGLGGADEIHVLIGPEGGWTDDEVDLARANGFVPARLGHTVLRVETAAVAVLAALMA